MAEDRTHRVLESFQDQENLDSKMTRPKACRRKLTGSEAPEPGIISNGNNQSQERLKSQEPLTGESSTAAGRNSSKRPLESDMGPGASQASKKSKTSKTNNKKGSKKKILPLEKGQKTLTSFMRV